MPIEHLQTVTDAFEQWNRREFGAAAERFTDDCEWHSWLSAVDAPVFRGRAELESAWRDVLEHMELELDFARMEEVGDKVLVDVVARATGERSGAPADSSWFQLYSFRGGLVSKVEPFASRDDAIAAAERA